ncbi:MAG TPA: Fic family protein [Kofleriaceae bacterium]|nr:Fic family protein [Kofleriaceae bacterium]
MADSPIAYRWQPIEAPHDPSALALPELRALEKLWRVQRQRIEKHRAWPHFWQRMVRWWSVETGVIERVFDISLGITEILIEQGFIASLIPHGESDRPADEVVQILRDHESSIAMVMDVVGGSRKLTVGWIKELHALICAHQETADAVTQLGQHVKVPLPKGLFKTRPNSPRRADGSIHEYCPPEHVAAEMDRLVAIYEQLPADLPEVRSAWLHHAFTSIHPFEDGNGRVARALASIDFIRSGMFPLLVERSDKFSEYIPALERADAGDLSKLIEFFHRREERVALRAISLAETAVEQSGGLDKILEAASSKLIQRQTNQRSERALMRTRIAQLIEIVNTKFARTSEDVKNKVQGCHASVDRSSTASAHYFRAQIVELTRKRGYWADLREPWDWVRLQLRDGGLTDFVVVLHFIGNPSPGACVAAAIMSHRPTGDEEFFAEMIPLDAEPLVLYPAEEIAAQQKRFEQWLDEITRTSLAVWINYL